MAVATYSKWTALRELAGRLIALAANPDRKRPHRQPAVVLQDADAIITHVEVCNQHGVGKLVQMLFHGEPNLLSIRSADYYGGRQEFGASALRISHEGKARDAAFSGVLAALGETTVKRILCIPYFADDVLTALAIKEIFNAQLCTFIMDDQNVCADGIPDDLMRELLAKSALRLAISPEMSSIYELKYGHRMHYMPPLAPARFIASELVVPPAGGDPRHGIIIGNIWGQRWVELLRNTVRDSAVKLTWYCNGEFRWLPCGRDTLAADSIFPCDPLPEDALIDSLRSASFAVVPSGLMDETDDRRFIAQLSLPSRMPYMMAVSQIPMVVLGSPQTGAAHFVEQFGLGTVADYDRKSFVEAVDSILRPEVNLAIRRRALALAERFTDRGAAEWIWRSLAAGRPVDNRFEDLAPKTRPDLSHLLAARL